MKQLFKNKDLIFKTVAVMAVSLLALPKLAVAVTPPDDVFPDDLKRTIDVAAVIKTGLTWLMYGIGIISVVMIIIGGIRYATSGGNAEKVKSAKNTILYAVVGLAVALLALAIVTFVNTQVESL